MTPFVDSSQLGIRRPLVDELPDYAGPIIKMYTIHARLAIYVRGINHQNYPLRGSYCHGVIGIDNA